MFTKRNHNRLLEQVPKKEVELLSVYQVTVKTSHKARAGTDSDILISLQGEMDGRVSQD